MRIFSSWSRLGIALVLVMACIVPSLAHRPPCVEHRVTFPPNQNQVIKTGLVGNGVSQDFLFDARRHQALEVSVTGEGVRFCIIGPDGYALCLRGQTSWCGRIPRNGEYRISVLPPGGPRPIFYQLTIGLQ